jgi:hypothetical protein
MQGAVTGLANPRDVERARIVAVMSLKRIASATLLAGVWSSQSSGFQCSPDCSMSATFLWVSGPPLSGGFGMSISIATPSRMRAAIFAVAILADGMTTVGLVERAPVERE